MDAPNAWSGSTTVSPASGHDGSGRYRNHYPDVQRRGFCDACNRVGADAGAAGAGDHPGRRLLDRQNARGAGGGRPRGSTYPDHRHADEWRPVGGAQRRYPGCDQPVGGHPGRTPTTLFAPERTGGAGDRSQRLQPQGGHVADGTTSCTMTPSARGRLREPRPWSRTLSYRSAPNHAARTSWRHNRADGRSLDWGLLKPLFQAAGAASDRGHPSPVSDPQAAPPATGLPEQGCCRRAPAAAPPWCGSSTGTALGVQSAAVWWSRKAASRSGRVALPAE